MKDAVFNFSFADMLGRRGDFNRDIRSVGDARGEIISCRRIDGRDDAGPVSARLKMPKPSGDRFSVISLTAFFDHSFVSDTIIIPEFNMAFCYPWELCGFRTAKLMSIIDKFYSRGLSEWSCLCAAAAVCALYEFYGRTQFDERCWGKLREMIHFRN